MRLDQRIPTFSRTLHDAGYRTARKWQMGDDDRVQPGYDYWAARIGTGDYWIATAHGRASRDTSSKTDSLLDV